MPTRRVFSPQGAALVVGDTKGGNTLLEAALAVSTGTRNSLRVETRLRDGPRVSSFVRGGRRLRVGPGWALLGRAGPVVQPD